MSDEIGEEVEVTQEANREPVSSDDLDQLSELDAILMEATEVDGGVISEDGQMVEHDDSEQIETSELLYPIISFGFDVFADKWKVKDKEKQALAEAYGALLDKYFPNAADSLGVELTALTVTAMVVGPKMLKAEPEPKKKAKSKSKNSEYIEHEPLEKKPVYRRTTQEVEGFKLD